MVGLIKKLPSQQLDKIRLDGKTRVTTLGRSDGEESPLRHGEETGGAR